MGKVPLSFFI